jgi:hypothetical protein
MSPHSPYEHSVKNRDWVVCCDGCKARRCWVYVHFIAPVLQREQVSLNVWFVGLFQSKLLGVELAADRE